MCHADSRIAPGLLGSDQRGPWANAGAGRSTIPPPPILEHPSEGFSDLGLNSFRAGEITPSSTGGRRGKMNLPALNSFSRLQYPDSQQTQPEFLRAQRTAAQGHRGWGTEGGCREPA